VTADELTLNKCYDEDVESPYTRHLEELVESSDKFISLENVVFKKLGLDCNGKP
jgi:hypothetical protein